VDALSGLRRPVPECAGGWGAGVRDDWTAAMNDYLAAAGSYEVGAAAQAWYQIQGGGDEMAQMTAALSGLVTGGVVRDD
jgi:hypothetical protein